MQFQQLLKSTKFTQNVEFIWEVWIVHIFQRILRVTRRKMHNGLCSDRSQSRTTTQCTMKKKFQGEKLLVIEGFTPGIFCSLVIDVVFA